MDNGVEARLRSVPAERVLDESIAIMETIDAVIAQAMVG